MRHLDLFSGIGGFSIAAREVWGDDHEIVGFCDNDHFCQNVLAKNFPGVPIYGDIRELTAEKLRLGGGALRSGSIHPDTLGRLPHFPTSDVEGSAAARGEVPPPTTSRERLPLSPGDGSRPSGTKSRGQSGQKRNAQEAEAMRRLSRDRELPRDTSSSRRLPKASQGSMALPAVSSRMAQDARSEEVNHRIDLLTGGFPCQPFSHAGLKRGDQDDRFLWPEMLRVIRETRPSWVLGENVAGIINMALDQVCSDLEGEGYTVQPFVIPACAVNAPHRRDRVWIVARHADLTRLEGHGGHDECADKRTARTPSGESDAPDTTGDGQHGSQNGESRDARVLGNSEGADELRQPQGGHPLRAGTQAFDRAEWSRDWREVAAATCHDRVDDGLPKELVVLPDGTRITQARWRKEALKAYGNSIVPQVAVEIMKAIKHADSLRSK